MTAPAPRVRVRINLPAPTPPAPRIRVRTINPPDPPAAKPPAPASVSADMDPALVCTLGEIVPAWGPVFWHGWPNGSAVQGIMGKRVWHKGRHIPIIGGGFHVIRYNAIKLTYEYVRKVRTHAEAMNAL